MAHALQLGNEIPFLPKWFSQFCWSGGFGVQLFFVASAFTMFYSSHKRFQNETRPLTNFFIRRFFRIAPIYYVGIVAWTLIHVFVDKWDHISVFNVGSNILFVHGIYPNWINSYVSGGWSISVEMSFYLLVPYLCKSIKSLDMSVHFFSITLIFSILLNWLLKDTAVDKNLFLYYYLPNQLPVFALGIIAYFIVLNDDRIVRLNTKILLFLSVILCCYASLPLHILFGISFLLLFIILSKSEFAILVNPVTAFLGKISYSMYLVHSIVFVLMQQFNFINYIHGSTAPEAILNYLIRLFINITVTAIISIITYKIIEEPAQIAGKNIINRLAFKYGFA